MTSLLRWASAFVLIAVVIGALIAYPRLRDRLSAVPTPTATAGAVTIATPPAVTPLAVMPNAAEPTRSAVVIQPAPTTPASPPAQPVPVTAVATPAPVATTSLLPAPAIVTPPATPVTPVVLAPTIVDAPATLTPTPTASEVAPQIPVATMTPIVLDITAPEGAREEQGGQPVPDALLAASLPDMREETSTPTPLLGQLLPTANRAGSLHRAPDATSPTVGAFAAGEALDIVALFTQGTWYLLTNGLWLPADAVDNAPAQLPLVVPTATPTFTPSPTPTFTPLPTVPPQSAAIPFPAATSLAEPVCACDQPRFSCVSIDFANREAAQTCFEYCFRVRGFDVHNLDENLNGRACENLPPAAP